MAVTFNLKSSHVGKIGTMASVLPGSDAVINVEETTIQEMETGVIERNLPPEEILSKLLLELGIKDDEAKQKAFLELVSSLKKNPAKSNSDFAQRIQESTIFRMLGKAGPVLEALSSAVTIGTAIMSVL